MSTRREYVLGTDEAELVRLGLQHRLWSDLAHGSWMRAGIAPGRRILDIGSGPGYASFDMAQIVGPRGSVLAVDESEDFVWRIGSGAAGRGLANVTARVLDAQRLEELAAEGDAGFDMAYARWVLCFVADPGAVIRGAAAVLRPGGRLCVNDYFNYESMTVAPRREAFSVVIRAVGRSWRERGGDPDVMGRVPALCEAAGLRVARLEVHQRLARAGDSMWEWPDSFWRSFVPRLQAGAFVSAEESRAFFEAWDAASADPASYMLLPPVIELIAEKRAR